MLAPHIRAAIVSPPVPPNSTGSSQPDWQQATVLLATQNALRHNGGRSCYRGPATRIAQNPYGFTELTMIVGVEKSRMLDM